MVIYFVLVNSYSFFIVSQFHTHSERNSKTTQTLQELYLLLLKMACSEKD